MPTLMNPKIVWSLIVLSCGGIAFASPGDALAPVSSSSNALRERYVEGLSLIAEFNAAEARAANVLSLVEDGASEQLDRIRDMENRLSEIKYGNSQLVREAEQTEQRAKSLLGAKDRLSERFGFIDRVMGDQRALLEGATSTVNALIEAADKSGRLIERRLADQNAEELKAAAARLGDVIDKLGQMRLRVDLEATLVAGLHSQAKSLSSEVAGVASKRSDVAAQVGKQRAAAERLMKTLDQNRDKLESRADGFVSAVETFRLVQVEVLRRWLLDGPPSGEMPALTIEDVIEAREYAKKPKRPDPSATLLGPDGLQGAGTTATSLGGSRDASAISADELSQASSDVIRLHRKARWYLAMLERLNIFAYESLGEAYDWDHSAEEWRSQFTRIGRTLANQRGVMTTLEMEQDVVTTTLELIAKQAVSAEAQVDIVVESLEKQTKRLTAVTAELKRGVAN